MRLRRAASLALAVSAGLSGALGAGCGDDSKASPAAPAVPATPPPAAERVTVTHILVGMTHPRLPKVTRTKEQAKTLADELMKDIAKGRKFEELVDLYTDDRDRFTGKPNSDPGAPPGSYSFGRDSEMAPQFEKAGFETPVGKVAPEPVETVFGYHIIRRDK